MSVKAVRFGFAGLVVLSLAACSSGSPAATDATPAVSASPESSMTAEPVTQLTADEIASVFTQLQFTPNQYADVNELINSIYPGLTTSDASCLSPFGAGWESTIADAPLQFGASNDRSMTAVVSSLADTEIASEVVATTAEAIERCAQTSNLFEMQGAAVATQLAPFESEIVGADETVGFRVTGDVGGSPFTLVGLTVRAGGNVTAIVGWDPSTNETYVPMAAQMFVDSL